MIPIVTHGNGEVTLECYNCGKTATGSAESIAKGGWVLVEKRYPPFVPMDSGAMCEKCDKKEKMRTKEEIAKNEKQPNHKEMDTIASVLLRGKAACKECNKIKKGEQHG